MDVQITNALKDNILYHVNADFFHSNPIPPNSSEPVTVEQVNELIFLQIPETYKNVVFNSDVRQQLQLNVDYIEIANSEWTHQILFHSGVGEGENVTVQDNPPPIEK